ncbi:hypothetical protein Tco_0484141 [Tanacetum coccineum]
MRKQQVLDLVLGGNQRVEFSRLFVLDGFQQERHSPLAQQRLKVNPKMVQMQISLTNAKANKLLMSVQAPFLNVQKTFDQHNSSKPSVFNDIGLFMPRYQCQMAFAEITLQATFLNGPHTQRQEMSVENVSSGLVPQGQKASDYDNSDPVPPRQNVVPSAEMPDSSHQGLEFLFSPLLEEYYNPTHDQAEENNNDQARMLI